MPLKASSEELIGSKVFVLPYYGYGWSRADSGPPTETVLDALGPRPFDLHVDDCIFCEHDLMGMSGTIINASEGFDGYWCCCILRNADVRDLTANCGDYIVWVAKRKLQLIPEPFSKKALGDWVVTDKSAFCWGGYGTVSKSARWIAELCERVKHSREHAKEQLLKSPLSKTD